MEVNQPLPSNEELLLSSDAPSSMHIRYGISAITGLSTTSTQSKSRNKSRDSPLKAITRLKLLMVELCLAGLQCSTLCATVSTALLRVNHDVCTSIFIRE